MDLIKIAEEAFATGKQHPSFKAGDTVTVAYRIVEGNKERVQLYRGVVIKISGHGEKKRFTVRKMSGTVGVERIFPIESPAIDSIEVNKIGKVRRAKLYYLRNLTGKKARIKEKKEPTPKAKAVWPEQNKRGKLPDTEASLFYDKKRRLSSTPLQQNPPRTRLPKTGTDAKIAVSIEEIHKRTQVCTSFQSDDRPCITA